MERHLRRPLHRTWTVWTTDAVALRHYVSALVARLDQVRVVSAPPAIRGLRLLHVQHSGDPDDGVATATRVMEAAGARLPVVVTAHSVVPRIGAWERDASALVATTRADAQALHRRWPAKQVEWIPHGCPPPVRCLRRARDTIGIVGAAPEVERSARRAGRRVVVLAPGQRAQPELARLLAERTDVVVFADAAACRLDVAAALASGVPVVSPPDPRLGDLEGAIHQSPDAGAGALGLLDDDELRRQLVGAAREYCQEHSWHRVAQQHVALWAALEAT
jgi:hypothetical protein